MKGQLTKDFALLMQRKKTFVILAIWAVVMCFTIENGGGFMMGWLCVITSMFAVSSISYDEYDNCFPFLMSLPVDRKLYVTEKYLFGFLCGFAAWLFAAIVLFVQAAAGGSLADFGEEMLFALLSIPIYMLLIALNLPLVFKFGTEKGRIYLLIVGALVFLGVYLAVKLLKIKLSLDFLNELSVGLVIGAFYAAIALITAISFALSLNIMRKKEF